MSEWYINSFLNKLNKRRGLMFGSILVTALLAFELFNLSTTEFAFSDFLGGLKFLGIRWATILAIAFCTIDFAGIARLFTPESGTRVKSEAWYLLAAWFLAATMNAMLTWWGVSVAILNHQTLGNELIDRSMLLRIVPVFIAVMVWLIRVLIIGTISQAGERLFSQADRWVGQAYQPVMTQARPKTKPAGVNYGHLTPESFGSRSRFNPVPKPSQAQTTPSASMQADAGGNYQVRRF
jgi:hypothetical protein